MLDRQSILIVEDEPLIALSLSIEVEALEGSVIGPVSTAHEALSLMDLREISAAILDAHLVDRDVIPVALLLAQRGIPFVVHSSLGPAGRARAPRAAGRAQAAGRGSGGRVAC